MILFFKNKGQKKTDCIAVFNENRQDWSKTLPKVLSFFGYSPDADFGECGINELKADTVPDDMQIMRNII